jgi:hypothetical protein
MSAEKSHRESPMKRVVMAVTLCVAALGAGLATRDLLESETARAHALVAEGERVLARNDRPAAILSFERARWLAPRAQFVRAAVATAGVKDVEPLLPRALRLVTVREWSAIATTFGWISAFGVAVAVVQWERRRTRWLALAAGCASVIGMAGVVEANSASPAIVTSADASLLVAPYSGASGEVSLPAGTMVLVGSRYDAFVHVRDADGQAGWVPRASVEPIAASES